VPFSLLLSLFFEPEMLKPVTPLPLPKPTLAPKLAELPLCNFVKKFDQNHQ
jgi:hypothetical protein